MKVNSVSTDGDNRELVSTPTLHLHGLKDPHLHLGRKQLAGCFDKKFTTLYEIEYHHAMPWVQSEVNELAELIRQIHRDTSVPTKSAHQGEEDGEAWF